MRFPAQVQHLALERPKNKAPPEAWSPPGVLLHQQSGSESLPEAAVGLAVVEDVAESVGGVLDQRGDGEDDQAGLGAAERKDVGDGQKPGQLAEER